jgi:hypothetical protein
MTDTINELMQVCAELRDGCERAGQALGQKVHEADRWIAATAKRLRVELVSDDAVFRDLRGSRCCHDRPDRGDEASRPTGEITIAEQSTRQ